MQHAAFLCVICVICERIFTQEYSINIAQTNPKYISQIPQTIADKPQNQKIVLTIPNLSFSANNAACCIPLRHLRENNHARVLNQSVHIKPQCLSQTIADEPQTCNSLTKLDQSIYEEYTPIHCQMYILH